MPLPLPFEDNGVGRGEVVIEAAASGLEGDFVVVVFVVVVVVDDEDFLDFFFFSCGFWKRREEGVSFGFWVWGRGKWEWGGLTSCQPHTGRKLSKKPTSSNRFG